MAGFDFDPNSERIALARRRLAAAYNRQGGEDVAVVEPNVCVCLTTEKKVVEDLDKMAEVAVNWANNLAATDNDWAPVIFGYCTVIMVPEAFGCEIVFNPDVSPWAKHKVSDISQVWDLKPKKILESPMIKRQFEWMDHAQRKLGTEVPFWVQDIQSPFSVAAQIVTPEELMMACITEPKAVHHICKMITEYTIEMIQMALSKIEHPCFPGANFPSISENIGLCIADDTPLVMLSPEMYREFSLPYNNQIGEVFGGVHIHSCGDYRHNLDNLLSITNIRSIQLHAGAGEFPLPESAEEDCPFNRARKKVTYFVDTNDVARGDEYEDKCREQYSEYVLPRLRAGDMAGCILQSCGFAPDSTFDACKSALDWTRKELSGYQK